MGWFSRFRHGRGFGVHSPFAYRLITEVLHEELPYYDWHRVKGRQERLLYRLVCRFRPESVSAPAPLAEIVRLAEPKALLTAPGSAAFVVTCSCDDMPVAKAALLRGAILIIFGKHHKAMINSLIPILSATGHGMVFDNQKDIAILVPDQKLPFQVFNARF